MSKPTLRPIGLGTNRTCDPRIFSPLRYLLRYKAIRKTLTHIPTLSGRRPILRCGTPAVTPPAISAPWVEG